MWVRPGFEDICIYILHEIPLFCTLITKSNYLTVGLKILSCEVDFKKEIFKKYKFSFTKKEQGQEILKWFVK